MSLWRPDRLCIGLDTAGVHFAQFSGRSVRRWQRPCATGTLTTTLWQAATDALAEELLDLQLTQKTKVEVLLGAALVRYLVVPWNSAFSKPASRLAYATHCFRETFGELGHQWSIRLAETRFLEPAIAVAIDAHLLERLREQLSRAQLHLASIQPATNDAFHTLAAQINDQDFWFVVASDARYAIFREQQGAISHAQVLAATEGSPTSLIERIKRGQGLDVERIPAYFAQTMASGPRLSLYQWKLTRLTDAPPQRTDTVLYAASLST